MDYDEIYRSATEGFVRSSWIAIGRNSGDYSAIAVPSTFSPPPKVLLQSVLDERMNIKIQTSCLGSEEHADEFEQQYDSAEN